MSSRFDDIVDDFDKAGFLDGDGIQDRLLELHEALGDQGLDPESPETYKVILSVIGTLQAIPIYGWSLMSADLTRCAARALRDLRQRGN